MIAEKQHSPSRRGIGFFAICLGYFAIILDGSVLNVAIPTIRRELGSSVAGAQWVLNGYTLTLAALLLTAGALGDRIGLRRMLLTGLLLFTAASAGCAAAPNTAALIGARIVQGLGAAALLPATLALIPHLFDEPAARARAAVIWVATGAGSVALGPLVGGLLIDGLGWRSIFLINVPVGVASMALAWRSIDETPRHRRPVDWFGQLFAAASLGLVTVGLIRGGSDGWATPATIGFFVAGLLAGGAFWIVESHTANPMLPPVFLRNRLRTVAIGSAGLMGFVFYGCLYVMSLYFQQARGWSPGSAGIALLPLTVASLVGPLAIYRPLARRYGHRWMLLAGFGCSTIGAGLLGWIGGGTPYPVVAAGLLLVGGASTIAFSALTSLIVASTPADQAGLASGVQNTTRQAGALLSVAVLGSVLNVPSLVTRVPAAFIIIVVIDLLGVLAGAIAVRSNTVL